MKLNWAERLMVNNPLRLFAQKQIVEWMGRRGGLQPGKTILEVGCGRGAGADLLIRRFRPRSAHILDLDTAMMCRARNYFHHRDAATVAMCAGSAEFLPYRNESFDAVFCFGVLHHMERWQSGVAEISRVLRRGGTLFLEEYYPPIYMNPLAKRIFLHPEENRFYSSDLRKALKEHDLPPRITAETKKIGIVGVCVKG